MIRLPPGYRVIQTHNRDSSDCDALPTGGTLLKGEGNIMSNARRFAVLSFSLASLLLLAAGMDLRCVLGNEPVNRPMVLAVGAESVSPASTTDDFPVLANKPKPVNKEFEDCPPEGDGGDPDLNKLKNRIDTGRFTPVKFSVVEQLPFPASVGKKHRDKWTDSDTEAVAKFEGTPISVEGFLLMAKEEGPESCNCHGADEMFHDFHIWLSDKSNPASKKPRPKASEIDRSEAMVIEITPPIRNEHETWTLAAIKHIVQLQQRVRISGWLLLDQEHPEQIGKTRGTLWEIHPIVKIEVKTGTRFKAL